MENKRNLKIRITILYIVYFAALLGGVIYNTGPQFVRGAKLGFEASGRMFDTTNDDILRLSNIYIDIPTTTNIEVDALALEDDKNTTVTVLGSQFNFIVSQDANKDETDMSDAIFSSVGGSSAIYFGSLMLMGLSIAIIVLLFMIIHSLHRSVKNDLPLNKKCVWYTRFIGMILIITDILSAWSRWAMAKGVAKVLEGSEFTADTTFTLNYYTLLLAVLVIFTAEVFSIGSQLGEEQKLTI